MFPRRYFAGRFFAPRYWSQSQGGSPAAADLVLICETTATAKRHMMTAHAADRLMTATAKRRLMKAKC